MKIDNPWVKINENWLKSGLTQKRFCQENNISYSKFVTARSTLVHSGLSPNGQPASAQENKTIIQNAFIPVKMSDQNQSVNHSRPVCEFQCKNDPLESNISVEIDPPPEE